MTERTTLTVRTSRDLSEALDEAAHGAGVSKSQLVREVLTETVLEGDDYDIPDHLVVLEQREQIKRRNKVNDLRGGFRGRVWNEFHERFSNGYDPDAIAGIASGYLEEARLLFDDDEAAEHIGFIRALVDQYRESYQLGGEFHRPEDAFTTFSGVEEALEEEEETTEEQERALEEARLEDANTRAVAVSGVQKRAGVDKETAEWAVDQAWSKPTAAGGVYAND